jgi:hypothetical protein
MKKQSIRYDRPREERFPVVGYVIEERKSWSRRLTCFGGTHHLLIKVNCLNCPSDNSAHPLRAFDDWGYEATLLCSNCGKSIVSAAPPFAWHQARLKNPCKSETLDCKEQDNE